MNVLICETENEVAPTMFVHEACIDLGGPQ